MAFASLLLVAGCLQLEPPVELPLLPSDVDEVHIVARVQCTQPRAYSGDVCHVIADPARIDLIQSFLDKRLDGWSTPIAGAPIHPVRIEFYRDGELIEAVGLSSASIERRMFLSRRIEPAEVDELLVRSASKGRTCAFGWMIPSPDQPPRPLSRNRLRSPTAEQVVANRPGVETASAGLARDAEEACSAELVEWADIIFVMERAHRAKLQRRPG